MVSTIISSYWVYRDAAHEVEELFDASLAQTARVLHGMITRQNIAENKEHLLESLSNKDVDFDRYTYEATPHGHKYEKKVSFQVWGSEDELLLHSASVGKKALAPLVRGFSEAKTETGHWRVFTLYSSHDNYWLIVAERDDIRTELTHEIARDHMIPVILCLPVLGILIWFILGRGFHPLRKIARQVETQDYEKLSEIETKEIPKEVDGLLSAINNLFARLNQSYRREQQFVSDAAHELRNPLAGVLIHTENILDETQHKTNDDELAGSLKHIQLSTQRLSRLVSQLLVLSRADSDHFIKEDVAIDLGLLVDEVCHDIHGQNKTKLSCDIELGTYKVDGNPSLLEALFRNLIDNAIRYSPDESKVIVKLEKSDESVSVIVEDSGPGIPEQDRDNVFKRFYRSKIIKAEGSGLGLAIASRIATLHNAIIELGQSELGGLLVRVTFSKKASDNHNS